MKVRGKKSERTEGKGRERKKEGKHSRLKIGRNIIREGEKSQRGKGKKNKFSKYQLLPNKIWA